MINIILAMDQNYWNKAHDYGLWKSLAKNVPDRNFGVKLIAIGFDVPENSKLFSRYNWGWQRVELEDMPTYRKDWPKNRPFFVCAEGGDFYKYMKIPDTQTLIHMDADMVMQREFTTLEYNQILDLRVGEVGSTLASVPSMTLESEAKRLNPQAPLEDIKKDFPNHWDKPLFCSGMIVAKGITYRRIIKDHYIPLMPKIQKYFDHHAAGQWLMNWVVYEHGSFVNLHHTFSHADWFIGSKKEEKDNKLLYNGDIVLFNHHKFNKIWSY